MRTAQAATEQPISHAAVVGMWVVIGILTILGGVGVIVTSVIGDSVVQVPVRVTTSASFGGVQPCAEQDVALDTGECRPPDGWREDVNMIAMPFDGLTLDTFDDPWGTRLLARAPSWVGLIAGGIAVLILVPVIRNTAQGRPFAPGNASRLATATGVVGAAWAAGTLAWFLAARLVVARLEQQGLPGGLGEGWVTADLRTVWWPLIMLAMLATLAAATRRGAILAAETEGLV